MKRKFKVGDMVFCSSKLTCNALGLPSTTTGMVVEIDTTSIWVNFDLPRFNHHVGFAASELSLVQDGLDRILDKL